MRRRALVAMLGIAVAAGMAGAAEASAAPLYVDDSGTDELGLNNCTVPTTPCDTIEQAHDQPGSGNVIHLGGGTYSELVFIDMGDSLIENSTFIPAAAGQALIDTSSTTVPAVQMDTTGTVAGLTISSPFTAVFITASGTLSNNRFEFGGVPLGQYNADVVVGGFTGAAPTISGNTFIDPSPEGTSPGQLALVLNSTGSPTVSGNSFDGFSNSILALSGSPATPTISGNVITGTHDTGSEGVAIASSGAIAPTLVANSIHSPGAGTPDALFLGSAGATLRRNRIIGHEVGVNAFGNTGPLTLSSDLIAKTSLGGLVIGAPSVGVSAANVTIVDTVSASDVIVGSGTTLALDSSIVGAGAGPVGIVGNGTCTITFSRGTGGGGCATGFTSTANPIFANPAGDDYHLLAGSPMIDAGDTTAPAPGTLDLDGDPRALAVAAQCAVPPAGRRDIGADEFVAACPVPTPPAATPTTPAAKVCKKGQKLKKGKCVKKKRQKRR